MLQWSRKTDIVSMLGCDSLSAMTARRAGRQRTNPGWTKEKDRMNTLRMAPAQRRIERMINNSAGSREYYSDHKPDVGWLVARTVNKDFNDFNGGMNKGPSGLARIRPQNEDQARTLSKLHSKGSSHSSKSINNILTLVSSSPPRAWWFHRILIIAFQLASSNPSSQYLSGQREMETDENRKEQRMNRVKEKDTA